MKTSTSISKTLKSTGINANEISETEALETKNAKHLGVFVKGISGNHNNHVVICQIYDGEHWYDTDHSITGEGYFDHELCVCESIRTKIITVEDSASIIDITIIIK